MYKKNNAKEIFKDKIIMKNKKIGGKHDFVENVKCKNKRWSLQQANTSSCSSCSQFGKKKEKKKTRKKV